MKQQVLGMGAENKKQGVLRKEQTGITFNGWTVRGCAEAQWCFRLNAHAMFMSYRMNGRDRTTYKHLFTAQRSSYNDILVGERIKNDMQMHALNLWLILNIGSNFFFVPAEIGHMSPSRKSWHHQLWFRLWCWHFRGQKLESRTPKYAHI